MVWSIQYAAISTLPMNMGPTKIQLPELQIIFQLLIRIIHPLTILTHIVTAIQVTTRSCSMENLDLVLGLMTLEIRARGDMIQPYNYSMAF